MLCIIFTKFEKLILINIKNVKNISLNVFIKSFDIYIDNLILISFFVNEIKNYYQK